MFIEKLTIHQRQDLLWEMRIHPREDVRDYMVSFYTNRLRVNHGKTRNGERIESIYKDFEIEKIYNSEPSRYDQKKFQNFMTNLLGQVYADHLKEYLKNKE